MKNLTIGEFLAFIFIVLPLSLILSGWTLSTLWSWFVVTTFHMQPLTIAQAAGLGLVVMYVTHQADYDKERKFSAVLAQALSRPAVFLVLGFAVHWYI